MSSEAKSYNTKDLWRVYRKNGGTLCYEVYKDIISRFNKKISLRIVEGYKWTMPYLLGIHTIVEMKRKFKIKEDGQVVGAIDWIASKRAKQALIEAGKLPYVAIKNDEGKIIGDNGGEKYQIYRTDELYYRWIKLVQPLHHNNPLYVFEPTRENQRTLIKFTKESEDVELLFERSKKRIGKHPFIVKITEINNAKHQNCLI